MFKFLNSIFEDRVQKSWEKRGKRMVKLRIEFEDGEVRELKGNSADEWWKDLHFSNCGRRVDWTRHKFEITRKK